MRRIFDLSLFIEAIVWTYSSAHESFQEQINRKRQLVWQSMRRAHDTHAMEHQLMWRKVAESHLSQIQQMESKRLKYLVYGAIGTLIGIVGLLFVVLMAVLP